MRRRRRRVRAAGGLLAAVSLVLGGCATVQPAQVERMAAPAVPGRGPIAWPARDPACFEHPIWKAALEQSNDLLVVTAAEQRGGKLEIARRGVPITRLAMARAGAGMLSEFDLRISEPAPEPARRFAFFSSRTPVVSEFRLPVELFMPPGAERRPVDGSTVLVPVEMDWPFGAVDPEPDPTPAPPSNVPVMTATRVRVYPGDATIVRVWPPAPGAAFRGYAVALRPIAGRAYTLSTLKRLRDDGWLIVESGLSLGTRFARELRDAPADSSPATLGATLASEVDEQLAELAYAIQAVLERLDAERRGQTQTPETGPRVLVVGFSGGALAAPAVAARLGERVDGAVLVGGGAGIGRILQTSTLTQSGLVVRRGGKPIAGDDLERLDRAYLDAVALDPVKTAPRLAGVPVLVLHAQRDDIVPAAAGDELHRLLERPERWVFDTGHELLFWRLSAYAGDIAGWVRDNVPVAKP